MWHLVLFLVSVAVVCTTHFFFRWRSTKKLEYQLPPGSMGWPFVGETLQLFRSQSSFDVHPFIKSRIKRYGRVFKTNLVRRPVVISTDPEFSHFIFQEEGKSVELYIPFLDSYKQHIEKQNFDIHKYIRNMVLDYFGTAKYKERLVGEMEEMALRNIANWSKQSSVEVREVTTTMAFGLASEKLISYNESKRSENLKDLFTGFLQGLMAFPVNIPGMTYHKCIKDQRKAMAVLKKTIQERLSSQSSQHADFLDVIIAEMKKEEPVFDVEGATYLLFALFLASFETISLALTLALKFISEHPAVLKELKDEHERIIRERVNPDSAITWNEYKSMIFTCHVIDETLRLGNVAPLIFRRATRDIQVNGYTIPYGWAIMVYPPAIHLDPAKYEDPLSFNPWRWKGQGSNTASKSFMPFGGGMRLCAGSEYTKLQMTIVLHFLVTKYRWTKIKGGEIIQRVGVVFPNGLHIKVVENN